MSDTVVIADASCLISLFNIGKLDLLEDMFKSVCITHEIQQEFGMPLPAWMVVKAVSDQRRQAILELELDPGEASAVALAMEKTSALLIIDERKGRKVARNLGIQTLGTLGVLLKAKQDGVIPLVKPLLDHLNHVGFRISDELYQRILHTANE